MENNHDMPPFLPADASLPRLVIDTREQRPLDFRRLSTVSGTLQTGDYSIAGCEAEFAVERKSWQDLLQSITTERPRFMRELARLKHYPFRRLLVVGRPIELHSLLARRKVTVEAVLGTLAKIDACFCPVVCCSTPADAAGRVECWAACWWVNVQRMAGVEAHQPAWAREGIQL